jgi:hypothetical protein
MHGLKKPRSPRSSVLPDVHIKPGIKGQATRSRYVWGWVSEVLNRFQERCRSVWEMKKDNRYSFDVSRPYVNFN